MIPPLYKCQQDILDTDPLKSGIFLGTGVGKSRLCLELAQGKTLVICPKQQKIDRTWEWNNEKFNLQKDLTVWSKETFRRDWEQLEAFDTVIFDECHNMLGVLPETRQRNKVQIPKTSQIFEASFLYLRKHPPKRMYMASATPVTKPMNLWALAKLMGHDWDFFKFRSTFYFVTMIGRRQIWMPRKDNETLERLAQNVRKMGYTGALKDFADVPEQTHKEVYLNLSGAQKKALKELQETEADALVKRGRMRTIENGVLYGKKVESISDKEDKMVKDTKIFHSEKIEYILERAIEFPKLLIFAMYSAQIEEIAKSLKKEGYKVLTVTGQTKDRGTIFKEAEEMEKCIIVAQAGICEGYRIPSIPCTIYASKSNRFVHYEQSLGRTIDMEHLNKKLYIHLIVKGGSDEACHKSAMSGADFQERL